MGVIFNLEAIFKRYKSIIENKKWYTISLIAVYVLGIVLGVIFFSEHEKVLFADNVLDFLVLALCKSSSPISLFWSRIINALALFTLFALTSLTIYLSPLHYFIIIYRGYVLGAAGIVFITNFKITGLVLFVFCVFLQNLITTLSLILYSTIAYKLSDNFDKCKNFNYKAYVFASFVFFLISVIGALIELILLLLILRPLNFYF